MNPHQKNKIDVSVSRHLHSFDISAPFCLSPYHYHYS
jgi:hypothetical protein